MIGCGLSFLKIRNIGGRRKAAGDVSAVVFQYNRLGRWAQGWGNFNLFLTDCVFFDTIDTSYGKCVEEEEYIRTCIQRAAGRCEEAEGMFGTGL